VLAVSLLGACATGGPGSDEPSGAVVVPAIDDRTTLHEENLRVVGTYAAASGRLCRRLADADGRVLARVSCRQPNGEWTLGRTLGGAGPDGGSASGTASSPSPSVSRPLVPALGRVRAKPEGSASAAPGRGGDPETITGTLAADETLWSFAARTTGDAKNWKTIAWLNGIEDAADVDAGRTLEVPKAMVDAARPDG